MLLQFPRVVCLLSTYPLKCQASAVALIVPVPLLLRCVYCACILVKAGTDWEAPWGQAIEVC